MQPLLEYETAFEKKVYGYIKRLDQIERILEHSGLSLVALANDLGETGPDLNFPVWVAYDIESAKSDNLFTSALCTATLQRARVKRRRFPWVRKLGIGENTLLAHFKPKDTTLEEHARILDSESYGGLNPLMAAQVFRVFLRAGEHAAHSSMGFLIFFTVLWALGREEHGAGIEPWPPTTYVTATCLLAIRKLEAVCGTRAGLLDNIADILKKLDTLVARMGVSADLRSRWEFFATLDRLHTTVARFRILTVAKEQAHDCAEKLAGLASDEFGVSSTRDAKAATGDIKQIYSQVLSHMEALVHAIGSETRLGPVNDILNQIGEQIVSPLETGMGPLQDTVYEELSRKFHLLFSSDYRKSQSYGERYRKALYSSATAALGVCRDVRDQLERVERACKEATFANLQATVRLLADANHHLEKILKPDSVRNAANWCRDAVHREIAYISAGDHTNFDPSELVCGIAVAVHYELLSTALQVGDAIGKALHGLRPDGSWQMGKPVFSSNHELASWPVSSDTMWMLTSAVRRFPEVEVADEAFFRYLDWLDRTTCSAQIRGGCGGKLQMTGWSSDRLGQKDKIHLETTAFSINAVMEIQELIEYRLWQLCEQRFTLVNADAGLSAVDPVDMGTPHGRRLHSLLAGMARDIQDGNRGAKYSLILHGPPGTSKTFVSKALAYELARNGDGWRAREARLVRVTPADFTRKGEDRIDSEARVIFDLLRHVHGVTILFDEIDDLLRVREDTDYGLKFIDLVVPAMLNRLQDLRDACPRQQICFVIATNYVERIEPALLREGRIDRKLALVYPDFESRCAIVGNERHKRSGAAAETLQNEVAIAKVTGGWPYGAIKGLCEQIVERAREDSPVDLWQLVKEAERSIVHPQYCTRLIRPNRNRPELRDEYLRYLVCRFENPLEELPRQMEEASSSSVLPPDELARQLSDILDGRKPVQRHTGG